MPLGPLTQIPALVGDGEDRLDASACARQDANRARRRNCTSGDWTRDSQLVCEVVGDLICDASIKSQPIVKFGRYFVTVATLEHPFVDAHQPETEPAVLLTDFLNLLIGQVGPKRSTEQELGSQFEDRPKLFDALDASQIDAAKVTHIGVVATDDFGAGVSQRVVLLLEQVE